MSHDCFQIIQWQSCSAILRLILAWLLTRMELNWIFHLISSSRVSKKLRAFESRRAPVGKLDFTSNVNLLSKIGILYRHHTSLCPSKKTLNFTLVWFYEGFYCEIPWIIISRDLSHEITSSSRALLNYSNSWTNISTTLLSW